MITNLKNLPSRQVFLFLAFLTLLLASCGGIIGPARGAEPPGRQFIPPTQAVPSPVASATPLTVIAPTLHASPNLPCTNNLAFISDITIPDGSHSTPESSLDKRWLVQNSGTCNWDERYTLKLIAGSEMGAPKTSPLYPARSSSQATFRIIFTAPAASGEYRSAWQAYSPEGESFGDPIYIDIVVP